MATSYSAPVTSAVASQFVSPHPATDDELAATSTTLPERQPAPDNSDVAACSSTLSDEDVQEGDITEELRPATPGHIELRAVEPSHPERRFTFLDPYEQIKSYFSEMTARRVARDPRRRGTTEISPSMPVVGAPAATEVHPTTPEAAPGGGVEQVEAHVVPDGRYTLKRAPRLSVPAVQSSEDTEHTEE